MLLDNNINKLVTNVYVSGNKSLLLLEDGTALQITSMTPVLYTRINHPSVVDKLLPSFTIEATTVAESIEQT